MNFARPLALVVLAVTSGAISLGGCGSSNTTGGDNLAKPKVVSKEGFKNAIRCDTSKEGNEVSYHDLSGRGRADMVQVTGYTKTKSGVAEGHVICLEIDTNHDCVLDLIRLFDDQGRLASEEADRNYDGKSDVWITYEDGLIAKAVFDDQFRGQPDEWEYFRTVCMKAQSDGACPDKRSMLKRAERDRDGDGKVDTWEFYVTDANGLPKLERIGIDTNGDGKVDQWYRDEAAAAVKAASQAPAASASAAPSSTPSSKKKEAGVKT